MEKKSSSFIKAMYVMAAVMFVICLYMIIYNFSYLSNYATTYGMTLGAMWSDVLQYVIAGSANYLAFGFVFLAIAKIYKKIEESCGPICTCGGESEEECTCDCECEEAVETVAIVEPAAEEDVKYINGVKIKQTKKVRY